MPISRELCPDDKLSAVMRNLTEKTTLDWEARLCPGIYAMVLGIPWRRDEIQFPIIRKIDDNRLSILTTEFALFNHLSVEIYVTYAQLEERLLAEMEPRPGHIQVLAHRKTCHEELLQEHFTEGMPSHYFAVITDARFEIRAATVPTVIESGFAARLTGVFDTCLASGKRFLTNLENPLPHQFFTGFDAFGYTWMTAAVDQDSWYLATPDKARVLVVCRIFGENAGWVIASSPFAGDGRGDCAAKTECVKAMLM